MKSINFLKEKGIDVDKSLEIFGDIETYNNTIGEFLGGIADKLNKLAAYKESGDMNNYAVLVHSLKSDAKYFGFTKLADAAYDHEMKSKANEYYYIKENFPKLETVAKETESIIRDYMSDGPEAPSEGETVTAPQPAAPAPTLPAYTKETILVADDSNIVRNFVKRIFSDKYAVELANDGEETINILEANKNSHMIVTLLLDLNMPKANGFKVLDYMKDNNLLTEIPVSIITGDTSKETIDQAFSYGIVDMLNKPFSGPDVKKVVEKSIYYHQMNSEQPQEETSGVA